MRGDAPRGRGCLPLGGRDFEAEAEGRSEAEAAAAAGGGSRVCVGIATRGRSKLVAAIVERLERQTLRAGVVIVSGGHGEDVADLPARPGLEVVVVVPGLARQRNSILRRVPKDAEFVVFFDDDFVAHADWIAEVVAAFDADASIACITGNVVADGITGAGIAFEDACAIADSSASGGLAVEDYSPYGCNMAFRCSALAGSTFDERLVLYGWLEDRDFGGALAKSGSKSGPESGWRLVRIEAARGVHMGVKQGRMPGLRLGYSQVINPLYMLRKGTITWRCALDIVLRNVGSNLVKSLNPEEYVDRRGRLHGNAIAVFDLFRGRLAPERAERL
jgi:Glycosyl transferase family 2